MQCQTFQLLLHDFVRLLKGSHTSKAHVREILEMLIRNFVQMLHTCVQPPRHAEENGLQCQIAPESILSCMFTL